LRCVAADGDGRATGESALQGTATGAPRARDWTRNSTRRRDGGPRGDCDCLLWRIVEITLTGSSANRITSRTQSLLPAVAVSFNTTTKAAPGVGRSAHRVNRLSRGGAEHAEWQEQMKTTHVSFSESPNPNSPSSMNRRTFLSQRCSLSPAVLRVRPPAAATLVLRNGRIVTVDSARPKPSDRRSRFDDSAVGSNAEINRLAVTARGHRPPGRLAIPVSSSHGTTRSRRAR
jgi:hypothetical protein